MCCIRKAVMQVFPPVLDYMADPEKLTNIRVYALDKEMSDYGKRR